MEYAATMSDFFFSLHYADPLVILCGLFHFVDLTLLCLVSGRLNALISVLLVNLSVVALYRRIHVFFADRQPLLFEKHLITRLYFNDTGSFVLNCVVFPLSLYSVLFGLFVIYELVCMIRKAQRELKTESNQETKKND